MVAADVPTLFAASVDIEGSLEGHGDVVLHGRVRGSIHVTGSLLIEKGGRVEADVAAREVINAGTVEGNITAAEKLGIHAIHVAYDHRSALTRLDEVIAQTLP